MEIIEKDYGVAVSNSNHFLVVSDFTVSDGIDIVENINIVKAHNTFEKVAKKAETFNQGEVSYIANASDSLDYFINDYDYVHIFTFLSNDVFLEDFTENLKVANSDKGFRDAQINISHVVYIDKVVSPKYLLKIYKNVASVKSEFLACLNLPIHIQNILNNNDFLAVAGNVSQAEEGFLDINNSPYDKIDLDKLNIDEKIVISMEDAFEKLELTFGILDYLVSEGILIGDLVEAGMELVSDSDELKHKIEAQILRSLEDVNVITLLMAAIRCNHDFISSPIREAGGDFSAYLYSDEVLGIAISNQIAGTEAAINFKRYKEAKPGIIYGLGLMLDDIFAGLIAGCVSKALKE